MSNLFSTLLNVVFTKEDYLDPGEELHFRNDVRAATAKIKTIEDNINDLISYLGKAGGIEMSAVSWNGFGDINIVASIPRQYFEYSDFALNRMGETVEAMKRKLGIEVKISPDLVTHPGGERGLAVYFPSWNQRIIEHYVESLMELNEINRQKLEFDLRTNLMDAANKDKRCA